VFFISLIIVYFDHLHIFPYSLFSFFVFCVALFTLSSLIVFRASVSADFHALRSCLTPIIVTSNKFDLI